MRKAIFAWVMVCFWGCANVFGFAGGDGSAGAPWQISTRADLEAVNSDLSACYVLVNDIDLSGHEYDKAVIANATVGFAGNFDGAGFVVSSLTIVSGSYDRSALFGLINADAAVENLGVENVNIQSDCDAACLVVENLGGIIRNCYAKGTVLGRGDVGGFIGRNEGNILNCYSIADVSAEQTCVGGFVGTNIGNIINCYSVGTVSKPIDMEFYYYGGFAGYNVGNFVSCFWNVEISGLKSGNGNDSAIGFEGLTTAAMQARDIYSDAGWQFSDYSSGKIGDWYMPADSYPLLWWQDESMTTTEVPDISGMTLSQVQTALQTAGFTVGNVINIDSLTVAANEIVGLSVGYGGRYISPGPAVDVYISTGNGGDGSAGNPYKVSCKADLDAIDNDLTACYVLCNNIDLGNYYYSNAVVSQHAEFTGSFNGNGFKIFELTILAKNAGLVGLFGDVGSGASLENIYLDDCVVSGDSFVGSLAGRNQGDVLRSYSTGAISGRGQYAGGLIGVNAGVVNNCYSAVSVCGERYVGGLTGTNSGTISNCYSIRKVTCPSGESAGMGEDVGGLVGINSGSIVNCYSSGVVSGVDKMGCLTGNTYGSVTNGYFGINCGYDNGVGQVLSDNQLQDKGSFVGFDFAGDTLDGTDDIWAIDAGYMPRFVWQSGSGFEAPRVLDSIITTLSGTGYSGDPFVISSYADLIEFRNNSYLRIGYYSLANDIDLAGTTYTEAFVPEYFYGSFDGNDNIVRNLSIDGEENLGFFNRLYGSVGNLSLFNTSISGNGWHVAGFVGSNFGDISGCHSSGSVIGITYAGGIVGKNYGGDITNCSSLGKVSGHSSIGGICGFIYGGTISRCFYAGEVTGGEDFGSIGGICGYSNFGSVRDCYSVGSVEGASSIGGLCGRNNSGTIRKCYSACIVSGDTDAGGLVGYQDGSIAVLEDCLWDTEVCNQPVGYNLSASHPGTVTNVIGAGSADMKLSDTYIALGWDFSSVWWIYEGAGYPHLYYEDGFLGGAGTEVSPFKIATAKQMDFLSQRSYYWDNCFVLTSDIDMYGYVYSKALIGSDKYGEVMVFDGTSFAGTFNGDWHVIRNLTIDTKGIGNEYLGLFGKIDGATAKVEKLGVIDVSITGDTELDFADSIHVGGLCGYNSDGTLENCYSTGSVQNANFIGGLCGYNEGTIVSCYSACLVDGEGYTGGMCGYNSSGTISDCYSSGNVIGDGATGGVSGGNDSGMIGNSYFSGNLSGVDTLCGICGNQYGSAAIIENCFWDVQASGQTVGYTQNSLSPGSIVNVASKTTSQMQDVFTFFDSGWDFSLEDGDPAVWQMPVNDYPHLAWERILPGDVAGNCGIDHVDIAYLSKYWGLDDCGGSDDCGRADVDSSGEVGLGDIAVFASNWLAGPMIFENPQQPYGGVAISLPGVVEAEDYDLGGEGIAYHDTTAGNAVGYYRSDDVDIANRDGGFNLAWTDDGEWLEYTVDVVGGVYDMQGRFATTEVGNQLRVLLDGVELGVFDVPVTGDWGVFETVTIGGVSLPDGDGQVLRLEIVGGMFNLNWVEFLP